MQREWNGSVTTSSTYVGTPTTISTSHTRDRRAARSSWSSSAPNHSSGGPAPGKTLGKTPSREVPRRDGKGSLPVHETTAITSEPAAVTSECAVRTGTRSLRPALVARSWQLAGAHRPLANCTQKRGEVEDQHTPRAPQQQSPAHTRTTCCCLCCDRPHPSNTCTGVPARPEANTERDSNSSTTQHKGLAIRQFFPSQAAVWCPRHRLGGKHDHNLCPSFFWFTQRAPNHEDTAAALVGSPRPHSTM